MLQRKIGWKCAQGVVALLAALLIAPTMGADRWEKDIAAFEKQDQTNPPPKGAVLFIGSSSIRMWKTLAEDFPKHKVINRGFGGSTIPDSTEFADRIIFPYKPSKIVLYAGDNDIANGHSPETVLKNYKEFVRVVHESLPETPIYFLTIKPSPSRWHLAEKGRKANEMIREFSESDPNLHYINLWNPMLKPDGKPDESFFIKDMLHLNDKGYDLWARVVREALKK